MSLVVCPSCLSGDHVAGCRWVCSRCWDTMTPEEQSMAREGRVAPMVTNKPADAASRAVGITSDMVAAILCDAKRTHYTFGAEQRVWGYFFEKFACYFKDNDFTFNLDKFYDACCNTPELAPPATTEPSDTSTESYRRAIDYPFMYGVGSDAGGNRGRAERIHQYGREPQYWRDHYMRHRPGQWELEEMQQPTPPASATPATPPNLPDGTQAAPYPMSIEEAQARRYMAQSRVSRIRQGPHE